MRKLVYGMMILGVLGLTGIQASVQNLATMSDIKEVIQILLKAKEQAEDRLVLIEKHIQSILDKEAQNQIRDAAIQAVENQIQELKNNLEKLQAAIAEIDPENSVLKNANGETFLANTYTTQKETTELKKLIFDELAKIKARLDNGSGNGVPQSVLSSYEDRLKRIEEKMKNCLCDIPPESEIK